MALHSWRADDIPIKSFIAAGAARTTSHGPPSAPPPRPPRPPPPGAPPPRPSPPPGAPPPRPSPPPQVHMAPHWPPRLPRRPLGAPPRPSAPLGAPQPPPGAPPSTQGTPLKICKGAGPLRTSDRLEVGHLDSTMGLGPRGQMDGRRAAWTRPRLRAGGAVGDGAGRPWSRGAGPTWPPVRVAAVGGHVDRARGRALAGKWRRPAGRPAAQPV